MPSGKHNQGGRHDSFGVGRGDRGYSAYRRFSSFTRRPDFSASSKRGQRGGHRQRDAGLVAQGLGLARRLGLARPPLVRLRSRLVPLASVSLRLVVAGIGRTLGLTKGRQFDLAESGVARLTPRGAAGVCGVPIKRGFVASVE